MSIEKRVHPIPFRTRKLSASSPMILRIFTWESRPMPRLSLERLLKSGAFRRLRAAFQAALFAFNTVAVERCLHRIPRASYSRKNCLFPAVFFSKRCRNFFERRSGIFPSCRSAPGCHVPALSLETRKKGTAFFQLRRFEVSREAGIRAEKVRLLHGLFFLNKGVFSARN